MTPNKLLLAAAVMAAIIGTSSIGQTQTVHYVGAGSSAQFLMSAVAQDQAANDANNALYGGANTVEHWTLKNGAFLSDNRNADITNEVGSVDVVWIQDGSGNVTDVWLDVQVDSTVGVRCFSAVETSGQGCQVQITAAANTASGNLVSPSTLWPDNKADVAITQNVINAVNTSVSGGVHVNVGLTDIRPEDALYATNRAYGYPTDTSTWKSLGYQGPVARKVGAPILTDQSTNTNATPIAFSLAGKADPFNTHLSVASYTTYPIGAAPIIFITNNSTGTAQVFNLLSGVTPGFHVVGQTYPLANLYDGTTACDTHNPAFGGNGDGAGTPLTVFLREPLSGTMNTTEFSVFRSFGNTADSQEKGLTNVTRSPYNPLHLGCPTHGLRSRGIGTGEIVGKAGAYGLLGTPNSIGYIFWGFANAGKFGGSSTFNYLTLDGVDPIWDSPTSYNVCVGGTTAGAVCGTNEPCGGGGACTAGGNSNQTVPFCDSPVCSSDLWGATGTFPNLRNGTYKAWSMYRWIAVPSSDPYGPSAVAQEAQNYVNQDVADFVPFSACTPGNLTCATPTDGLSVYRSHFVPTGVACGVANNGSVTTANSFNHGNTLGGGAENCGDVGGLIEGPFGVTTPDANGYVTWASTLTAGKGYRVLWKQGDKFSATWAEGSAVTLNSTAQTIASCKTGCTVSATAFYVTNPNPGTATIEVSYSAPHSTTHADATTPGLLNKHQ